MPTKYNFTPELSDMNASWPPSAPLTHVVSAGDTFASIAEDLFGDASYAFVVAASIGYSTHQKPPLGRVIRVMPTANMALHDHAGQFAPYASSRILGSLYPKIPMPPVNDDDSFFGMFLEFLVGSLLMTIAPWLTFELDDVLGAFMARVVGFAVGSSIADVGQQLVGMATGMQHGFHFKELEESFESGAIQGVLGKLLHIDPFDLQTAGSRGAIPFPRSLLYHELVNVATQSVELAAGQKRRWDWAGLTTALVQATGGEVSNLFGGHSKGNLMAITFNTLAGNGARSLIDHTPFDPEAVFAQITGTFIGQEVGSKLFPNPEEQQRKKEEQEQYFNYQDYLRSQREHSPWNEVDDLADDISGSNPYGDNVADRWSYEFSKGGSTVDPQHNSTRPSSDWQHVGFAVFGHAPKSDPETAPEPAHVAKQNAHHQAVQVKSQITVAHQQDRHESSAVRTSGVGSDVRVVHQKLAAQPQPVDMSGAYAQGVSHAQWLMLLGFGKEIVNSAGFALDNLFWVAHHHVFHELNMLSVMDDAAVLISHHSIEGSIPTFATPGIQGYGAKVADALLMFAGQGELASGLFATRMMRMFEPVADEVMEGGVEGSLQFDIAPRVEAQLKDPRLGNLAGKLDIQTLNKLANNPNAQFLYDTGTGHINIVQNIAGKILRITVPRNTFKIISVGRMQERNLINSISSGRFVPIGSQLEESLEINTYMKRIQR